jgi:capsular exopolysaccharide synthesis family protein
MKPAIEMTNGLHKDDVGVGRKIMSKYRPYWYIFLISFILGIAGAWVWNITRERVYLVKSGILIHEYSPSLSSANNLDFLNRQADTYNQLTLLESHAMVDSALAYMDVAVSYYQPGTFLGSYPRTEIYRNSPFRVSFDKNHPQPFGKRFTITIIDENWYRISGIKGLRDFEEEKEYFFGQRLQGRGHFFTINIVQPFVRELHAGRTYQFVINDVSKISQSYKSALKIEPFYKESSAFQISFKATNYQRAADFVNVLKNIFIQQSLKEKSKSARNTIHFIENLISFTRGTPDESEDKWKNFLEREQPFNLSSIAAQLADELKALDREKVMVEVKQRYYDFILEYIHDRRDLSEVFSPSGLGIEDPVLVNQLVELERLENEKSRLLLASAAGSASVQAIDNNIRQAKTALDDNIRNLRMATSVLLADLNRRIGQMEHRIVQLPGTEQELLGIKRMLNINEAIHNFLLEKQAEAAIKLASTTSDHRIIDQARNAGQVAPRNAINYLLGVLISLGLPFLIIGFTDIVNTRIKTKEQVSRKLGFPLIGIVPRHKSLIKKGQIEVVVFDKPFSPVTEAFRNIRSNLHFFSPRKKNNLIVVTSVRSGEGKTFTAVNLAAVLAISDKRTLYIDADIRKIQPNKFTSNMIDIGLSNYLIGKAELDDIINPSSQNKNMYIMNSGIISPNPAELIDSEAMVRLLTEELHEYEYIVVDTSPIGMVADAKPLMSLARLNMFVLRHNYTSIADMEFIKEYTQRAGIKNLVITVNDIRQSKNGFGHGYGFGYGFGYGTAGNTPKSTTFNYQS